MRINFDTPKNIPVSVNLVLPENVSSVLTHNKTEKGDEVVVNIRDDRSGGVVVEITDIRGKKLWHNDFGYNMSAVPGCGVTVSCHPNLPVIIIHYDGYKWDHSHKLLFIEKGVSGTIIKEYLSGLKDISPLLKRQKNFNPEYQYWIYPYEFIGDQIIFECIPIGKREKQSVHPFAQDIPWYQVTTSIDSRFKIIPVEVKTSH